MKEGVEKETKKEGSEFFPKGKDGSRWNVIKVGHFFSLAFLSEQNR